MTRVGWVLRVLTALEDCQVKGGYWERQGSGAEGLSCGRDGTFQNKRSVSINADLETEHSCQLPRSGGTMQLGLQGKEVTQERLELEKAACSQVLIAPPPPQRAAFLLRERRQERSPQWVAGTLRCWRGTLVCRLVWKLTWQQWGPGGEEGSGCRGSAVCGAGG